MTLDVTYGESWDPVSRTVSGPMSRQRAAARDAAGEQYAVVLREEGHPQPAAVLHVAWAQGYFGIWAYDDRGRRTREIDLRRLEPGELFLRHLAQWRYDTDDMAEFAAEAGRILTDLHPDGRGRKVCEPKGVRGGSMHTLPDVPENQRRVPAPEFGDWGRAVALATDGRPTGPLRETPTPETGGDRDTGTTATPVPSWRPPAPMRPHHLAWTFTPGTRFSPPYDGPVGPYIVGDVVDAGPLRLPTGRVVACDPGWDSPVEPFTVTVPPGEYRVEVAMAAYASEYEGAHIRLEDYTAARVLVCEKPTETWELALRPGEDPRTLRDGEFYGFGVDTGTGCFVDAAAAERLTGRQDTIPDDDLPDGILVLDDPRSGGNLIAYPSGLGDGTYPVWIGRAGDGEVTCLVADMLILHGRELLP
ncbi:DUF4241 domain-containing protein [Streptomyces sp. SAS_270]|uniref:DUF4241 domain-containing protein n=1 Tax=Streptomyces sp. SAS_270 TaxID=3412748 RepID=UPI00403CF1DA